MRPAPSLKEHWVGSAQKESGAWQMQTGELRRLTVAYGSDAQTQDLAEMPPNTG